MIPSASSRSSTVSYPCARSWPRTSSLSSTFIWQPKVSRYSLRFIEAANHSGCYVNFQLSRRISWLNDSITGSSKPDLGDRIILEKLHQHLRHLLPPGGAGMRSILSTILALPDDPIVSSLHAVRPQVWPPQKQRRLHVAFAGIPV